jgi:hypothetical protein
MTVELSLGARKKPPRRSGFRWDRLCTARLLDDLDYAVRTGVNQDRSIVDHRVAVFADTILLRNFIVGHAFLRKHCAHPDIAFVAVGRTVFFDDVMSEARTFIHAQNAVYTADDPSDRAANDGSHGPSSPLAFSRTTFDTAGYALSGCGQWGDYSCG